MKNTSTINSVLGILELTYEDDILLSIKFVDIARDTNHSPFIMHCQEVLNAYLTKKTRTIDIPYKFYCGTKFQQDVWEALKTIPYGKTISYKELASLVGKPKAYRAVGGANNKNLLPLIIPCHRVIGSDNNLVGYAGGLDIKKFLLNLENRDFNHK